MRPSPIAFVLALGCALGCRSESASRAPASAAVAPPLDAHAQRGPAWEPWSGAAFARARSEGRLVILDLEAVWCHWCHVMEATTYADPAVVDELARHFVCLKVDQDSRPDLSNRYEDYGWPATIVFDAQGRELAKRSGYIEPADMLAMLRAFVADPTPGPSARGAQAANERRVGLPAAESSLGDALRAQLEARESERFDARLGGFGGAHKFVDPPSVEHWIASALRGDDEARERARKTLDAGLALIDPVWGGVYQYSTGGVWTEPHFEKIAYYQAEDLRVYALAYAAWKDERHLRAAQDLRRFVRDFLTSPEGAFYTSQDADLVPGEHSAEYFALDDRERRKLGVPRVDTHVYARENGWMIRALCALHAATGDESALADARRAAEWIVARRSILANDASTGGFRHDERDAGGPFLGDTLAMGQAFLALYESSAERVWLERARATSAFAARTFALPAGYATSAPNELDVLAPTLQRDENVQVVRFESSLHHYTGDASHREHAENAMRYLAASAIALQGLPGGVLQADDELANDPLHITVVGSKQDAAARKLFAAALAWPAVSRRIEWSDASEGPLPNPDTSFPPLQRAAAFACGDGRCSSPAYTAAELAQRVRALVPRATGRAQR